MSGDRPGDAVLSDAAFAAWFNGLRFSVAPGEFEALQAAFRQLARMNELNRAPVSIGSRTPSSGTDK
jgi:hypothetical protein